MGNILRNQNARAALRFEHFHHLAVDLCGGSTGMLNVGVEYATYVFCNEPIPMLRTLRYGAAPICGPQVCVKKREDGRPECVE